MNVFVRIFRILIEALVVLTGLMLLWNACINPNVGPDASLGAGVIGLFCIIFGTLWLFE